MNPIAMGSIHHLFGNCVVILDSSLVSIFRYS